MNRKRHCMLIISDQDMLRAGNQLMFRAFEGYIQNGFDLVFLTNSKNDANLADEKELFGDLVRHLKVIRVPVQIAPKILLATLKRLNSHISAAAVSSNTPGPSAFPPPSEEALPFLPADGQHIWRQRFQHFRFRQAIYKRALELNRERRFDIVCGYEVMATRVARNVANELRLPLFNRYQGTFLRQALKDGTAGRLYPLHLAGSKVSADLHVMENDGTGGLEVLLALGHPKERILFLIDGVRKDIYDPSLSRDEVFAPYGIRFNKDTRIILTLSKLIPWKRHDRIIGAMPAILQRAPDTWLVVAHRGPWRPLLEQYASDLGVSHRVIFTGPVPHEQIYRFLNTCDVYVNCNDWSNLSNTVLEALECGKPVVSLNDGSLDGIITDGENGFLVCIKETKEELPDRIAQLLTDNVGRSKMSQKARVFAERNLLSWEARMEIEIKRVNALFSS